MIKTVFLTLFLACVAIGNVAGTGTEVFDETVDTEISATFGPEPTPEGNNSTAKGEGEGATEEEHVSEATETLRNGETVHLQYVLCRACLLLIIVCRVASALMKNKGVLQKVGTINTESWSKFVLPCGFNFFRFEVLGTCVFALAFDIIETFVAVLISGNIVEATHHIETFEIVVSYIGLCSYILMALGVTALFCVHSTVLSVIIKVIQAGTLVLLVLLFGFTPYSGDMNVVWTFFFMCVIGLIALFWVIRFRFKNHKSICLQQILLVVLAWNYLPFLMFKDDQAHNEVLKPMAQFTFNSARALTLETMLDAVLEAFQEEEEETEKAAEHNMSEELGELKVLEEGRTDREDELVLVEKVQENLKELQEHRN